KFFARGAAHGTNVSDDVVAVISWRIGLLNELGRAQQADDPQPVGDWEFWSGIGISISITGLVKEVALGAGRVESVNRIGDGHYVIGKVVEAFFAVANGVHNDAGIGIDDGVFAIFFLNVHARGQDTDDGDQGEADDGETDRDFDHG